MDGINFDSVSKLFANRRLSRREALARAGTGLAAAGMATAGLTAVGRATASAQDATPEAEAEAGERPDYLFLQSFQNATVVPKEGEADTYTLTLEQGLGQTIYFSDRPERIVGATPTPQFLQVLGFTPDNPPNAALLVAGDDGHTDIVVLELFAPQYDEASHTATYDVKLLERWEQTLSLGFSEVPLSKPDENPGTGGAHLFIDGDAPEAGPVMTCYTSAGVAGTIPSSDHGDFCYSWAQFIYIPCTPWTYGINGPEAMKTYWIDQCNARFEACGGDCSLQGFCSVDAPLGNTLCTPMA